MDPAPPRRPAWALLQQDPNPAPARPRLRPPRRPRGALLDHPVRRRVLEVVAAEPGQIASVVAVLVGANANVVRFHLRVLEGAGYIHAPVHGRRRCYLPQHQPRIDPQAMLRRASPAARRVLGALHERREMRFRNLCALTGLPPSTASAAVRQLASAGLVEKVGSHRALVVRLRPDVAAVPMGSAAERPGFAEKVQA